MISSGCKLFLPSSCFAFLSSSVGESGSMLTLLPYLSSVATLEDLREVKNRTKIIKKPNNSALIL